MVRQLAVQGNKIAAIKLLRDETGMGLREAKNAVERLDLAARSAVRPLREFARRTAHGVRRARRRQPDAR